jgi:hypothetical protein
MSKELFINFMREKRIEPTENDLEKFEFMAKSLMEDKIEKLEYQVDNAHSALEAVKASGSIIDNDVYLMIERGFDNKPQLPTTRLG